MVDRLLPNGGSCRMLNEAGSPSASSSFPLVTFGPSSTSVGPAASCSSSAASATASALTSSLPGSQGSVPSTVKKTGTSSEEAGQLYRPAFITNSAGAFSDGSKLSMSVPLGMVGG